MNDHQHQLMQNTILQFGAKHGFEPAAPATGDTAPAITVVAEPPRPSKPPVARLLSDLKLPTADDPDELLKRRFLCRRGGMLLVGPTGIGKSSLTMQFCLLWSIGKPAFGIQPAKPLKIVLIQAENDDGDLAEMRDGIITGLALTEIEAASATSNIIVCNENERSGLLFLNEVVAPLLEAHKPDLLVIDPALAFLGGETNSQKDVGTFLRNGLNPLICQHNVGVIVVHHTNKPPSGQEKPNWQGSDLAYLGSGSAEWANWARAVMGLRSVGLKADDGKPIFELCAPKRGARLGWQKDGLSSFDKKVCHSRKAGLICWDEVDEDEMPLAANPVALAEHEENMVLGLIPAGGIAKNSLLASKPGGFGLNKVRTIIARLMESKKIVEFKNPRGGKKPEVCLLRSDDDTVDPADFEAA